MRVYLDHNAGAPLRPEARAAMLEWLGPAANPSGAHREAARARAALEAARADVAALVGTSPAAVVFTSGATEANNLALRGGLAGGGGLVTTAVEHASILATARALAAGGTPTRVVGVDTTGAIDAGRVADCPVDTRLVSVGLANGEVGTIGPVAEIARAVHPRGILVHTDAAQAAGRMAVDVATLGADLLSLSAHKLGGPTGIGALVVGPGVRLVPQATGGPQERGQRAGTESVAAAVGFGVAARLARVELAEAFMRMAALTDRLWEGLRACVPGILRNGPAGAPRLPNTLNVTVPGCAGESILVLLDLGGIAVSLGSACAAGSPEASHVLLAMGRDRDAARNGVRMSLGPTTTAADIERVLEVFPAVVRQVRESCAA